MFIFPCNRFTSWASISVYLSFQSRRYWKFFLRRLIFPFLEVVQQAAPFYLRNTYSRLKSQSIF